MGSTRRSFLKQSLALTAGASLCRGRAMAVEAGAVPVRRYNLSVSMDALESDPALLPTVKEAGVSAIWLACFFYGSWHHSLEKLQAWKARIERAGIAVHHITIPLGHPTFSETPPDYSAPMALQPWQQGQRPDGRRYHGVCLHPPGTEINVKAIQKIKATDPGIIFVDDDFRLAPSPADIGGCFCERHREAFLERHGYRPAQWEELLEAVRSRALTPVLRAWLEDACDELTACFRAQQQAAAPEVQMGNMVMFLGSEKAGIRLKDYAGVPLRVGELMFGDDSFAPVKGKTDELFSALFHRRFVTPELAYSESTAWPPDGLSAPNMAAKLAVSTLSDVRNTMFMSGLTPFPRTHWAVLGPAMREQAALHARVAGHVPRGPFKHFWGEDSRWVGDANPFSLFLAMGVPFEVANGSLNEGWTFLSDADARAVRDGRLNAPGTTFVFRPESRLSAAHGRVMPESLKELFAFKRELMPKLDGVPLVEEDTPTVCAWYPSAKAVLLWNLTEAQQRLTLRCGTGRRTALVSPLGTALIEDVG